MKICMATILSIALLVGNSVNPRASVTGPVPSDGGPASDEACPMCCQGPAGIHGLPGLPGNPGCKGNAGQKGAIGPIGPKGEIGPIGPMGDQGAVGNPGPKGDDAIGLPGVIGPTGPTGVKGQKGEPGETPDDSNQRVAFTVVRTSSSGTSTSNDYRLPFQETKTLLPGTTFDLETGTFTCSSVPGTYVFMFSVRIYPSGHGLTVILRKNGVLVVAGRSTDPSHHQQVSGSAVLVLQRGDTVYLAMYGRAYSESAYHYTSFSGFLLYPE